MPAQRPRASFEPIPPDFDVRSLVENTDKFQYVDRISVDMIKKQGVDQFERLVLLHVIIGGKPLVVDGFEDLLDPWAFTPGWLIANEGDKVENARNLTAQNNLPLTIGHYLKNMRLLADQYFQKPGNYKEKNRQRIYLKDIDCPQVWHDKLKEHIPSFLFYLNESTGEIGGPGAVDEPIANTTGRRKGKGIARAGDLMSCLPPDMRAENLMCYVGHEGTYTPSHREMCASLGHNIMVNASSTIGEDGKPEKPGSSIWFMTETNDRHIVAEYWLSVLGHDIEVENHFAQVAAWKKAPFKTYIVEQRLGDFILIPPLAPHQVWNRGTRTVKVAWNRTSVETLEMAFKEALPNARMVCRDEQYKNKAIVYYALQKYSLLLKQAKLQMEASQEAAVQLKSSGKVRQVQKDFKHLFELYKNILLSETFASEGPKEHPEFIPFESHITCAYCRGNIFNRFLTCKSCVYALGTETEEPYDVCMDCYAMGRSCACISGMKWVEQFKWKDLLYKYEEWRKQGVEINNGRITEKTPLPLRDERRCFMEKTLAQVCQEQLKLRPWHDIKNPKAKEEDEISDEEIVVNDDGTVRKTVKKKSKAWLAKHHSCHVCLHKHPKWKMAACTTCDLWYCYGTLFRAHDLMPKTIMENPRWQCPHCLKICSAGNCRRDPRQRPYEPKGTLLGHDTKKVADARSVEALVDFGVSNLNWLRDTEDVSGCSARLQRRKAEAERAKLTDPMYDERYQEEHDMEQTQIEYSPAADESHLDPLLRSTGTVLPSSSELLNGARPSGSQSSLFHPQDEEYRAPSYVPPVSVIYQEDTMDAGGDNFPYPELEESVQVFKSSLKRRPNGDPDDHIKLVQSKKQRTIKDKTGPVKNDATKQFLKQQERQRLEQAKKEGRFIQVLAAMKGRKAVVTLRLPSEKLAGFRNRELEKWRRQQAIAGRDSTSDTVADRDIAILRSDLANSDSASPGVGAGAAKGKKSSQVRIRMEDDDDFRLSEQTTGGLKKKPKSRYEEIDISSSDGENSDDIQDGEYRAPRNRIRHRARADSENLVELPEDWRDGLASRKNRRQNRRQTLETVGAQIRPSGVQKSNAKLARASTGQFVRPRKTDFAGTISGGEDESENDSADATPGTKPQAQLKQPQEARTDTAAADREEHAVEGRKRLEKEKADHERKEKQKAKETAEIARKEKERAEAEKKERVAQAAAEAQRKAQEAARIEEEDRRAKLRAARWAEGDDVSDAEEGAERLPAPSSSPEVRKLAPAPPPTKPSIFSRFGPGGKKIRIVSAASKQRLLAGNATAAGASAPTKPTTEAAATKVPPSNTKVKSVKRSQHVVQLSDTEDSESDGEIPAVAPEVSPVARSAGGVRGRLRGMG